MIDKLWWHFENVVEWFITKLSKKAYPKSSPGAEDRCVAVTRDGRIYYGKGISPEEADEIDKKNREIDKKNRENLSKLRE